MDWSNIEESLKTLSHVDGGFSSAHRGIVTLPNGLQVFVKIGTDDSTKKWAKKEVEVYRFLQRQSYPFIPKLLACNNDETSFALEGLTLENGWDWSDEWTEERLDKTLEAMDILAAIQPIGSDKDFFTLGALNRADYGWPSLEDSGGLRQALLTKLRSAGYSDIANTIKFSVEAERSAKFIFRKDALVHYDVRADNVSWNARLQTVRLVDWNWMHLGDRRIDLAAMLVHVGKAGFDVTRNCSSLLDADALHWMAGYWFKAAATPIWPGGPIHLRDTQLRAGITALKLVRYFA